MVDGVAAVAAGYRLHTYASGTTTPQTTYQDQAGATPNANPIVLDAEGRCNLWLDPALEYTFVLRDPDGDLVKTWDDVVGTASTTSVVTSVNTATGDVVLAAVDMEFVEANGYTWLTATNAEDAINQVAERANAPAAESVTIEDAGSNFTATNVEGALAELHALASVDAQSGRLLETRYYKAAGAVNYTKPSSGFVIVEMVGGGAASGPGYAGSAGGYSRKKIAVADLDTTTIVTVGAGGASVGAAGGSSSFGTHLSATGGGASAGAGGTGVGGDLNLTGGFGGSTSSFATQYGFNPGGNSFFGGGGANTGGGGTEAAAGSGSFNAGYSGMVIISEYS